MLRTEYLVWSEHGVPRDGVSTELRLGEHEVAIMEEHGFRQGKHGVPRKG